MVMSDSEVKVNILQAKNQRAQIKICAELNGVCEEEIKDILKAQGVDLRTLRGASNWKDNQPETKPTTPAESKQKFKAVPAIKDGAPAWDIVPKESPITNIKNRIESLLAQRKGIDDELTDLKQMLTELIDSIGDNA